MSYWTGDVWMVPIVFVLHHMNINKWVGLKVKFLKCQYLRNGMSDLLHTWYGDVSGSLSHDNGISSN